LITLTVVVKEEPEVNIPNPLGVGKPKVIKPEGVENTAIDSLLPVGMELH
jgi:hypothetical protein